VHFVRGQTVKRFSNGFICKFKRLADGFAFYKLGRH
jgi:hypothetical protein